MILVEELSRRFNHFMALDNVSLDIKQGESFALLGPNGAGKTTLVRILSTLLKPSSGRAFLNNINIVEESVAAKKQIGVVSHNPFLYDELTAEENLTFFGKLYDCNPDVSKLLKLVKLEKRGQDPVGTFSRGMKQRLSIARAILHDPGILILDEPTAGLDITSRKNFYEMINSLKKEGKTLLLTTHYLDEAVDSCTRGALLSKGKMVAELDLKTSKEELEKIFAGLDE